ncbi:MAG: hypothetical protein C4308_02840 [Chitinophagaceae bacterium]
MLDSLVKKDTIAISQPAQLDSTLDKKDSLYSALAVDTVVAQPALATGDIDTRQVNPEELMKFAETLVGTLMFMALPIPGLVLIVPVLLLMYSTTSG